MNTKKRIIIIVSAVVALILLICLINRLIWNYKVAHAEKIVELGSSQVPVYEKNVKIKQLIKNINGKLTTNPKINTDKIGKQTIEFKYTTDEGYPVKYEVEIEVVDTIPPLIYQGKSKTIYTNYDGVLAEDLFCGDNYDKNPSCTIEGEVDYKTPGSYDLKFVGKDQSGNKSENSFTLIIKNPPTSSSSTSSRSKVDDRIKLDTIKEKYQGDSYQYGIDISHWQGDINFQKVKDAGVDFVYIRIGRGNGIGKEYVEDDKFIQNISGFNEVGIPVGVYFFSNANGKNDAKKEVDWIAKKIKKYKVDLEIVFDWEDWNAFQEYDLSFYDMKEMANAFYDEAKKKGYTGMLYSSKSKLEDIWYDIKSPIWLAHYTEQTDYQGDYIVWQLTDNGAVPGINGAVDIDIRYPNKNKG